MSLVASGFLEPDGGSSTRRRRFNVRFLSGIQPRSGHCRRTPVRLESLTYAGTDQAMSQTPPIGLLASGGLDSCILLGRLLDDGREVRPFYVRTGVTWEAAELDALRRFIDRIADRPRGSVQELVLLNLPLDDLYESHWSLTGQAVPDETTPDDAVYLPGRNALLAIKAALWCQMHGLTQLAMATLQSNPFPDATQEFFQPAFKPR